MRGWHIMSGRQAATVSGGQRDAELLPDRCMHVRVCVRPERDVVGTRRQEQRVIRVPKCRYDASADLARDAPEQALHDQGTRYFSQRPPPALRTLHLKTNVRSMGGSSHFDTRLEGSLVGP